MNSEAYKKSSYQVEAAFWAACAREDVYEAGVAHKLGCTNNANALNKLAVEAQVNAAEFAARAMAIEVQVAVVVTMDMIADFIVRTLIGDEPEPVVVLYRHIDKEDL